LEKRNTYTPTDTSQVRSHCGPSLKVLRGRDGVADLKTSSNNPDANLTARGEAGRNLRVSVVFVLNQRGKALMPCSPHKAKKLLKKGGARVVKRTPFTIQLSLATGEAKQPVILGVDSGYIKIGLSAVSEKKELYTAEVRLREDIVNLNSERRAYRRNRRHRKTWYRKPRFLNRKKAEGWLAPSIQHKLDSHLKVINQLAKILPITKIIVEVANFDIQKIKNPNIQGKEYQKGDQSGFWNVREYVLHRDGHECQGCKGKSKDLILVVHHIKSRKVGSNRPENLITLCQSCHKDYHQGKIKLKVKPSQEFKAETFMTMVRWTLVNKLKTMFHNVEHTYGYLTKTKRIQQKIRKSHINDAFVIGGGKNQRRSNLYIIKQVRNSNRKLFKGKRSHVRNTGPRVIQGFKRFDKVLWKHQEVFIFGRRNSGYFDIRKVTGEKIHSSVKAKELKRVESAKTMLISRTFLPSLKGGVSSALEVR